MHKEIKMTRRATCLVIILMVGSIINLGVTARQYYAKREYALMVRTIAKKESSEEAK